jgi:uncharacterized membrane protein YtjA (UPF0391 family)
MYTISFAKNTATTREFVHGVVEMARCWHITTLMGWPSVVIAMVQVNATNGSIDRKRKNIYFTHVINKKNLMNLISLILLFLVIAVVFSVFGFGGASSVAFGGAELLIGFLIFIGIMFVILKVADAI